MPSKPETGITPIPAHCYHLPAASAGAEILWIALAVNLLMFGIGVGLRSGSVSLLADAIDYFGDAANYGVTLAVLCMELLWCVPAPPCSKAPACWPLACLWSPGEFG